MNAIDLRSLERNPASGVYPKAVSRTLEVRRHFIDNWGRLAGTFGMSRDTGRVHAQLFIEETPCEVAFLSRELGLSPDVVKTHLGSLLEWGVIRAHGNEGGEGEAQTYATTRDPWEFFLEIVRQRHRREFMPILDLVRETANLARELGADSPTRTRIGAFSKFVEDLSSLIELFAKVGSRPMALALKTFARMAPRA